jgi:hypothetical protein
MAVIHAGMMKATARMNEELDAARVIDPNKREAANVRACRLAAAISRMSATYQQALLTLQRKRTGGSQHVYSLTRRPQCRLSLSLSTKAQVCPKNSN